MTPPLNKIILVLSSETEMTIDGKEYDATLGNFYLMESYYNMELAIPWMSLAFILLLSGIRASYLSFSAAYFNLDFCWD